MRLSSIFSFDTFRIRPFVPLALGLLAAMLLSAELLLRLPAITAVLPPPEPTLWHAELIQAKVDFFRAYEAEQPIDVLFLGNSTMQAGLNPAIFDQTRSGGASADGAFNASIEGMPPVGMQLFLRIYLKDAAPQTIVYGLTPQDLNENSPWARDITDRVTHAPLALAESGWGVKGRLIATMLETSQLYRYRLLLYRMLMSDEKVSTTPVPYFDARGYHRLEARLADVAPAMRGGYYNRAGVLNYSAAGEQVAALEAVIQVVQEKQIALILVNMPLAEDYYGNFDSPADYDAYLAALTAVAQQYDLPLVDLETGAGVLHFTDQHFADFNHLNQAGAEQLSRFLAEQYVALQAGTSSAATP